MAGRQIDRDFVPAYSDLDPKPFTLQAGAHFNIIRERAQRSPRGDALLSGINIEKEAGSLMGQWIAGIWVQLGFA